MRVLLTFLITLITTGCASYVDIVGAHYNQRDPCQNARNDPNWEMPNFCGGGRTIFVTRRVGSAYYTKAITP